MSIELYLIYMVLYNESREVHKSRRECGFGLCAITICLQMSCSEIWSEGYILWCTNSSSKNSVLQ